MRGVREKKPQDKRRHASHVYIERIVTQTDGTRCLVEVPKSGSKL